MATSLLPSPTLPPGFRRSIWSALEPSARANLLNDFLSIRPELETVGTVDFNNPREPLLRDQRTGQFVSLAGELVLGPGEVPVIAITRGNVVSSSSSFGPILLAIAAGVALAALA